MSGFLSPGREPFPTNECILAESDESCNGFAAWQVCKTGGDVLIINEPAQLLQDRDMLREHAMRGLHSYRGLCLIWETVSSRDRLPPVTVAKMSHSTLQNSYPKYLIPLCARGASLSPHPPYLEFLRSGGLHTSPPIW